MNREEEIKAANPYGNSSSFASGKMIGFTIGAEWADAHPKNPWISVEERLPENNTVVLTRGAYGFLICQLSSLGEWETGANVNKERLGITHWMPIPSFDKILEVNKDYWNELKRKEIKYEKDCTVRRI